jgi:hypothetical protein
LSDSINASGATYIYIAIRRGPMKVPTTGTTVFSPIATNSVQGTANTTGFPVDTQIMALRGGFALNSLVPSRLTSVSTNATSSGSFLRTSSTANETTGSDITQFWGNTGFQTSANLANSDMIYWNFKRAPSFFDEVCYTGTGVARTVTHNLAAVPELMIVKCRTPAGNDWMVYASPLGNQAYLQLNRTNVATTSDPMWNNTTPTSSVFSVGVAGDINGSGYTLVAYLFATCAGVSKVGSYSGNTGVTVTVPCGFTSGVRFVLIKRTDVTGAWYVWDSARGIVAGNDPYLLLNSTAAEVTSTDYVDTYSAGFEVTDTAPAALNATGGTYIFLAIA